MLMKNLSSPAVIAISLMLIASPALAEKDPKCMARCQLKDQAAQPACFAACPDVVDPPPPPDDAGISHPVDSGIHRPPPPPPPPRDAGPVCDEPNEVYQPAACNCAIGYGRLTEKGPCLAVCKDGEVRDAAGKCALPPPCEPKAAPPPPPTGGDWWWILLVLLLASLGANGWQYANRNKKGGPKGA